MTRILHYIIGNMNQGGISNSIMSVYRNIDRSKYQFDFITHSHNDFYREEIESLGGKIYYVDFKSKHPVQFNQQIRAIIREHPEYKVMHVHTSYAIVYFDTKIAKKSGIEKIIIHSHASHGSVFKQNLLNRILKRKLDILADKRVAVSKDAARWLFSKETIKQDDYSILNNSIDVNKFVYNCEMRQNMRQKYDVEDSYVLGVTSRLHSIKNLPFLLDVVEIMKNQNYNIKLFIVGDGAEKKHIERLIEKKKIQEYVILVGGTNQINSYLNMFDVFLFPSLHEGLGISVLEAVCCGLPTVISSKLPEELNISELVIREELEPILWVEKIVEIIKEMNVHYARKTHMNELVEAGFDVTSNSRNWEKFYDGVL